MTREEILALFARRQQAWDARDPDALAGTHAQHGTLHSPMFATVRGRPQILESYRSLFRIYPDLAHRGEDLIIDGHRVAQPFTATATHVGEFMGLEGTGRRFTIQGVALVKVEEGLIVEERRIYDFTGLLVQTGILKTKPAKP